jgi:hypothetical protein
MTKLPTRENGRLDCEKLADAYHVPFNEMSVRQLLEVAVAHTIERCARVAESMAVYVRRSDEPTQFVHASDAAVYKAADAIRKLEV